MFRAIHPRTCGLYRHDGVQVTRPLIFSPAIEKKMETRINLKQETFRCVLVLQRISCIIPFPPTCSASQALSYFLFCLRYANFNLFPFLPGVMLFTVSFLQRWCSIHKCNPCKCNLSFCCKNYTCPCRTSPAVSPHERNCHAQLIEISFTSSDSNSARKTANAFIYWKG